MMRFQLLVILSFGVILAFQTSAAEAADVNDFVDFSTELLPGRLYVPPEAADPSAARPLILFLYGAGEIGRYYELDVTDLVRADYAADSKNSVTAFRLQVSAATFFEDDLSHRYRFTLPGAEANPPELVLTFIPEPSTGVLAAFGLLGLFAACSTL